MTAHRWTTIAFGLAILGALVVAFAPFGTACVSVAAPGDALGHEVCRDISLFASQGSWVLVVVSVPTVLASLPTLIDRRPLRVATASLLWACCLVGIASVGLFFVPAAVAMTVAGARHDPAPVPTG